MLNKETAERPPQGELAEDSAYLDWLGRELASLPQAAAPAQLASAALARVTRAGAKRPRRVAGRVRYASLDSPLGLVFLAYGDAGIVRVGIGKMGEADFAAELAADFGVFADRDEAPPRAVAATVASFLAGHRCRADAFDLGGLPDFERRVLLKALEIPWGEVRSYSWLARELGCPGGARAVGQALGRNPVPLLIPCHRVLRGDGSLGGYAFGLELKRQLLAYEGIDVEELRRAMQAGEVLRGCRTTRIYCLPTCRHARRVAPANRVPFRSVAEAKAAGYRPCKVCRPS